MAQAAPMGTWAHTVDKFSSETRLPPRGEHGRRDEGS